MSTELRILLALFLFLGEPAFGEPPPASSDWRTLGQLTAGQNVEVRLTDSKRAKGKFEATNDQSISILVRKGTVSFERARVAEVRVRTGKTRTVKTLIGAGVGAGIGLALWGIGFARSEGNVEEAGMALAAGTMLGATIGAGVGALLPVGWWTVYRAGPPK